MMMMMMLALAAAAPARDVSRDLPANGLDFHYGWPAAANALPRLRARLEADLAHDRREALGALAESRRMARANRSELIPHDYSKDWAVAGATPRLLSLTADLGAFSGGAHPNTTFEALLWDRQADRAVAATAVLGAALPARVRARFCRALDAERAERREEPVRADPQDEFTLCPPFRAPVLLAPADTDHNGRFETLSVLMAPYVAGPYVDGAYTIDIALDAGDVAAIPVAWRAMFEPAGRRRR
jgi:hypothetical protein